MWQHAAEHLEHMLSRQQGIDYSLESGSNAGVELYPTCRLTTQDLALNL
jgi:hypothetical protein